MTIAPNWYADPSVPAQLRWWDGTRWTEHVAPVQPALVPQRPEQPALAPASPKRVWPIFLIVGVSLVVVVVIAALMILGLTVVTAIFGSFFGDFFETWQGVYCGETGDCG